jgi:hypothetical protein
MSSRIKSAVVIAKLLGTEGFTDFVANQVELYWKRRSGLTKRQWSHLRKLDAEMSRITCGLSKADTLVIGKFIGLHKKMSFDTGLKIGLQAYAQKCNGDVEIESGQPPTETGDRPQG